MTKATYTRGPWIRSGVRIKLGTLDCLQVGPDGHMIAFVPIGRTDKDHAEAMRDAALIATAPDLLHVAKLLVGWLDEEPGAHKLCDTARAAIAKATGQ